MKAPYIFGVLMAAGLMVSTTTPAADYMIDKKGQHASVTFKASHLGYSYIIGRFNDFEGEFSHDAANPGNSMIRVSINAKSIDTNHALRDKHLRGADFFNVTKYPIIKFESSSYASNAGVDILTGNLTLHGTTKSITIKVNHIGEGKDPWGGYRSGFEGETTVNAAQYGLPDWVGDVQVMLNIEGIRQ